MNADSPNKKFNFNIDDVPPEIPQTINIPNTTTLPTTSRECVDKIEKYCKFIRWSSIPLSLIQLLFILPQAFPLLVTMVMPVLGFLASYKYYEYLTRLFAVYMIILIFIQILTMIILRGTAYIVVQSLFIIFELVVAILGIKTAILMKRLTTQDWHSLLSE